MDEFNIFGGISKSHIFCLIVVCIFFLQAILVTHGGYALNCYAFGSAGGGGLYLE